MLARDRVCGVQPQAKALGGLLQAPLRQLEQAQNGLGVHAVEVAVDPLQIARGLQQRSNPVLGEKHRGDVRHGIEQGGVGKGLATGQIRQGEMPCGQRFVVAVLHGQKHGAHAAGMGAKPGIANVGVTCIQARHGLPRAARQAHGPDGGGLQAGVLVQQAFWHGGKPARQQAHAPLLQELFGMDGHQAHGVRQVATLDRVVDGGHGAPLCLVPA